MSNRRQPAVFSFSAEYANCFLADLGTNSDSTEVTEITVPTNYFGGDLGDKTGNSGVKEP